MVITQSYQEVSKVIAEDLRRLKKFGVETLGEIDVQRCFYIKRQKHPIKYGRLGFDTNGPEPYSEDLSSILDDFRVCGILRTKYDILPE
jgi:hypothetical protein